MQLTRFANLLAILVAPVLAAPSGLITVFRYQGEVKPGSYVVTLKEEVSPHSLGLSSDSIITHQWSKVLNGFAASLTDADLNILRASDKVATIAENGVVHTQATQTDATWGLQRISSVPEVTDQTPTDLTFTYKYDDSAGAGTDVYIIDTGIFIAHPAFGGRASWGATFVNGSADEDGYGHGTHCAGIAVSTPYGVAKGANVIAVKVLDDSGNGQWADVISGVDWVATAAQASGRPSVGSMSLGSTAPFPDIDTAVAALVSSGVPVAVAAGNYAWDAANGSPADTPSAITVGSTNIADQMSSFSNFGTLVDIFAPGEEVTSTWNDGGVNTISGTSMATPHVAGLVAYLFGIDSTLTPDTIDSTIKSLALQGALTAVPSGTSNALLQNGYTGA